MSDDSRLKDAVLAELKWEPSINAAYIGVTAKNSVVTLMGHVESYIEKSAAESAASRVKGVKAVAEKIAIKTKVDTSSISSDIDHALHRSWFFDPQTIFVTAQDGRVRLTGDVETYNERAVAGMTAWAAPGATSVENDIRVTG